MHTHTIPLPPSLSFFLKKKKKVRKQNGNPNKRTEYQVKRLSGKVKVDKKYNKSDSPITVAREERGRERKNEKKGEKRKKRSVKS